MAVNTIDKLQFLSFIFAVLFYIVWHCLHNSMFSHFHTIPECDRYTHRHTHINSTTACTALA